MKILILLQAVSSRQDYRNYLRVYERIKLLERGKLITRRTYIRRSGSKERQNVITCFNISESSGIVPLKLWKHNGGIATSQWNRKHFIIQYNQGRVRIREAERWKIPMKDADCMGYYE